MKGNLREAPFLRPAEAAELTGCRPASINRFRLELEADGAGRVSTAKRMTLLQGVLQHAREWDRLPSNPARAARKWSAATSEKSSPPSPSYLARPGSSPVRAAQDDPAVDRAGRNYARVYSPVQRAAGHAMVEEAVTASGGRLLFSSGSSSAPLFVGVEAPDGERTGVNAYVFHASKVATRNRPSDEHRAQIRYGDVTSKAWRESGHPLGFDPAGVDLTLVLAAHREAGLLLALDPLAYEPLPLGNSIYFKDADVDAAARGGWRVWERNTHSGSRKGTVDPGLETIVAFTPNRFLDFLAVERQAQTRGLDHALRFRVAERGATEQLTQGIHELEKAYGLSSFDLLDIVGRKSRLAMAMRGGVAEHHLGLVLDADSAVRAAEEGHQEGPPDFFVELVDGRPVTVECKNASPKVYADGTPKVEVQKTRASQGDPTSRFYTPRRSTLSPRACTGRQARGRSGSAGPPTCSSTPATPGAFPLSSPSPRHGPPRLWER